MTEGPRLVRLRTYREYPPEVMRERAEELRADLERRRTVRDFSDRPVPRELIETLLSTAGSAPSGANLQPWRFVAISDPAVKRRIRDAAEAEERDFYEHRAPKAWLEALAPLGTDWRKPFLETAPWLIAVFVEKYSVGPDGERVPRYYPVESVGLATGFLIAAAHRAGLASLTHTPSPMGFLNEILGRPSNEKPFLLLVVGYPTDDARVPDIERKPLAEIATFVEGPRSGAEGPSR